MENGEANERPQSVTVNVRVEHDSYDEHIKKQQVQRLKFLLEQTTVYSNFLADKLQQPIEHAPEPESKRGRRGAKAEGKAPAAGFQQPRLVTGGRLRAYQLEGVEWLVSLFENGLNGILADEMGLGKTLQCISFLAFLREQGIWGPFLIVAPLSTIGNWAAEVERFAPTIPVLCYHGSIAEREELRASKMSQPGPAFPVIVTSYEIAMKDKKYLQRLKWKYLIVDEGHRIKNMNCKLVRELKAFDSANRLLLTGTPLQNNLAELWSLLNFLLPDVFDDLASFQSWFDIGDGTTPADILDDEAEVSVISNLHTILKPFLLRRLKADVEKELPKKKEYLLYAGMSPAQQGLYQAVLTRKLREYLSGEVKKEGPKELGKRRKVLKGQFKEAESDDSFTLDEASDSELGQEISQSTVKRPVHLQNALMQLRKVCNHPFLFDQDSDGPVTDERIVSESGKMQLLDQLLMELLRKKHKVLIFSQMSRMLDILEDYLTLKNVVYCRIDGSVAQTERVKQMNAFNTDKTIPVFLLTTRAGGLGINLVSADTVIFYDSDWNPQMDLQAQDRAHRIGQTRPVIVYRLAVANSVESRILERAASKRRLERMVIHQKKFKGKAQYLLRDDDDTKIGAADLEDILKQEETERLALATNVKALSPEDLALLTDRSEAAFEPEFSRRLQEHTESFKELQEIRDQTMDSLAQLH